MPLPTPALVALSTLSIAAPCSAQFLDAFEDDEIGPWQAYTGDGDATVAFLQKDGYARIEIDATLDQHNVWWAIVKRDIADSVDLERLQDPDYELRVEARVRVGEAPRRVNMMVNTQRTIDYHVDLREFDIDTTEDWKVISMTTTNLDAVPGDSLFVQLAATDWGRGYHHVDLDYYRAEVIDVKSAEPDKGEPLLYHPPTLPIERFAHHLEASHDSILNQRYPDVNFNDWRATTSEGESRVLTVSADQWPVARWDFGDHTGASTSSAGILELTTHSIVMGGSYVEAYGEDLGVEFGKVRVIEVIGGDPSWDQRSVTYQSFMQGDKYSEVFNSQMTFDVALSPPGSKTFITLSRPVMQRLLNGTTKGLVFRPLGALEASFYATENATGNGSGPILHFNAERD